MLVVKTAWYLLSSPAEASRSQDLAKFLDFLAFLVILTFFGHLELVHYERWGEAGSGEKLRLLIHVDNQTLGGFGLGV